MDRKATGRHCRSKDKETRTSSPTQRAIKRDRSRTIRTRLSPRIDEFARQLQQHESAGSTSTKQQTSREVTSRQLVEPAVSTTGAAQPGVSTERRSSAVDQGTSPILKSKISRRKVCEECHENMYRKNWRRHIERCHKHISAVSDDRSESVASVQQRVAVVHASTLFARDWQYVDASM